MKYMSTRPGSRLAAPLLCAALAASPALAGCAGDSSPGGASSSVASGTGKSGGAAKETPIALRPSPAPAGYAKAAQSDSTAAPATSSASDAPGPSASASSTSAPSSFKPFQFTEIPSSYRREASKAGRLETIEYRTSDPEKPGTTITKKAVVYLPYEYRDNSSQRYNILYLMHGSQGNERTWLGTQSKPTTAKNILDHMIADRRMAPTIVAMPAIRRGSDRFASTFPAFPAELTKDVMPAVEGKYRTYAASTTPGAFAASRGHRAFGGFSLGGGATWSVFRSNLKYFEYFLPISGIYRGSVFSRNYDPSQGVEDLANVAQKSGAGRRGYFIFAATGTDDSVGPYMTKMVDRMLEERRAFDYTDKSFANGNLTLLVVNGKGHNYTSAHTYLYNALPHFFRSA